MYIYIICIYLFIFIYMIANINVCMYVLYYTLCNAPFITVVCLAFSTKQSEQ